ncbi:hypothetical protein BAZMOX_04316_2 [methanotrophic endosymbiont of Bathymodiolus azoricus (Menez Gwen)]|nr:hypothetical protein BAZMOX_04316_2 [methanotrophic endosymbiont of Bathymodiolus azoricus (Menez Gwen)]
MRADAMLYIVHIAWYFLHGNVLNKISDWHPRFFFLEAL